MGLKLKLNHLLKGSVLLKNYEPDKQLAFKLFLEENDVFFDVGANVGLHSYYVAMHIPSAKIYAFEPLTENVEYIRQTIKNNNLLAIELIESAVSDKNGETSFDVNTDNSRGNITNTPTGLKVSLITLDQFCKENRVNPSLLKIDVEGAEGDVLKGSENLIASCRPTFIVELHSPEQDLFVANFFLNREYQIYRLNEAANKESDKLLIKIKKPEKSWPDPDGVFGSIAAIPNEKFLSRYDAYIQ